MHSPAHHSGFPHVFFFFPPVGWEPPQVLGYNYPRKLVSPTGVNKKLQQTEVIGFLTPLAAIPAMHTVLPSTCSFQQSGLWDRRAARSQPSMCYLSAQMCPFAPFRCNSKSNWIFRDSATTAPQPRAHRSQCRECRVMGLREQGGILHIPPWRILHDFHGPYAKLFALCSSLLQYHEKKPGISKSSFISRSLGTPRYSSWQPTDNSLSCSWMLGPNRTPGRIQKLLSTIIF